MKVELVNKHLDRDNTILLKASSSLGEMYMNRLLLQPDHYEEGEERKAFYNVNCFDSRGMIVCGRREDHICGFDYMRIKKEFLRVAKDNSYLESLIQQRKEREQRK